MSILEKAVGTGAVIMALCCAVLPVLGAAVGGGLIGGAGTVGVVAGVVVLAAVVGLVARKRGRGAGC